MFFIDPERLNEVALRHRDEYREAAPFPHAVIDGLFPEEMLRSIIDEFPRPGEIDWVTFRNREEKKLASRDELQLGAATRMALYQLNSSPFVSFLETLTGIDGLIPDPHFWGGGLHQIERGGYLKVHADFNRHERLRLDRRLNLLLYLNADWREEYGGHLELWDREMKRCERRVLPIFNRCVVFSTTDYSYHGHPDPVTCPEGWTRKSLALYYYSNGRPSEELSGDHGTLFKQRPDERRANRIRSALKKLARGKRAYDGERS